MLFHVCEAHSSYFRIEMNWCWGVSEDATEERDFVKVCNKVHQQQNGLSTVMNTNKCALSSARAGKFVSIIMQELFFGWRVRGLESITVSGWRDHEVALSWPHACVW